MNILLMMIPVTITIGLIFVLFFLSAVKNDQFEDLETPGHLPLSDDSEEELGDNKANLKDTSKVNEIKNELKEESS